MNHPDSTAPATSPAPWRLTRWHWLLLLVALAVRLVAAHHQLKQDPFGGWDGKEYYAYAGNLMHGRGDDYAPRIMNFVRAPFYSICLIPFRALTDSLWPVLAAQSVLGCFVCVLLARLAARWTGPRAGDLTLVLSVINPFLIYPCAFVLSEGVFLALGWLGMACLLRLAEPRPTDPFRWVTWAGLWWGLACLTRGALLPFLPLAALWLGGRAWRRGGGGRALAQMCVFTAVSSAVLLPWMIGSRLTAGEFTVAPRQAAMIAAVSLSPEYLASYHARTKEEYYSQVQGVIDRMAAPPPERQLAYWKSEPTRFRREHADQWRHLQFHKAIHFWTPWLNPLIFPRSQFLISVAWNVPVFAGALWGLLRQRWDAFVWLLVGLSLVTFLVHFWLQVAVRYRYPTVDIAFLLLAVRLVVNWRAPSVPGGVPTGPAAKG